MHSHKSPKARHAPFAASLGTTALAFALVFGIPTNSALFAQEAQPADATPAFEDSFERFEDIPPAPEPAPHAVDITEIEPPVEAAPEPAARNRIGSGVASYYGQRFAGRKTASGERFNPRQLTAAHKTLPFGTIVEVTNPRNGKRVNVRINDRGPYAHGRTIDLSRAAAEEIGLVQRGHGTVELALVTS
ncbi:septal ring lytic transglycosylase RlpA family protein [Altererythrobacter aquiaggeris]|uniref:septal ring lytic transglycosylase RlpA family protein n=1 Tax=Aestuarierythrobacter aquiaggeris TaxID=1898396 RepID=UPI0030160667